MKITLDIKKSVSENANHYFELAKKYKKKLQGVKIALENSSKKLEVLKEKLEHEEILLKSQKEKVKRKVFWFEKFRWFISSKGFLCIGGRDATTNEILIKKHLGPDDIVIHTDMAGSPFFIVKKNSLESTEIDEKTIEEAAATTFLYSKAYKAGYSDAKVFWVKPEQVSKEAESGEYLQKGSFMIRGKTNYVNFENAFAISQIEFENTKIVMCGPLSAIKSQKSEFVQFRQGKSKTSQAAKEIAKRLNVEDIPLDDIIKVLPQGIDLVKAK